MAKVLNPKNWDGILINPGTRCRIKTSIRKTVSGSITRVNQGESITLYGQIGADPQEELLATINTNKSQGKIQFTAANGLVLQWLNKESGTGGVLMTFP